MADKVDPKVIEEERLVNELGKSLLVILKEQARVRGEFNQETKQSADLARQLSMFTREDLTSARKRERFQKKLNDAYAEQRNLQSKISKLEEELVGLQGEELENGKKRIRQLQEALEVSKETTDEAEALAKEYKTIARITKTFDMFGKAVGDVPVIRELFSEFVNASSAAAEAQRKGGNAFAAGVKEFGKGIGKATLAKFIFDLFAGTKVLEDFGNKLVGVLQIPVTTEDDLKRYFATLSNELGEFDINDAVLGVKAMTEQLGTATVQSNDFIRTFLTFTDRLGISAEATGRLAKFAAATGDSFEGVSREIVGMVALMNDNNDLNLRFADILYDVSNASEATLLTTQKFPGGLAQAAFQARKFGLTLGQLENTSNSLLNFQSSIESELEAELLTGRRLNLEQARMASLMGDQATLASEIAKNVGTSEEFAKMNVIQQEALAKAFGMSRQELAKTLIDREALLELEKTSKVEGLAGMKASERIAALTAANEKKGMNAIEARREALRELGEEELLRQEQALDFEKEISKALKDLQVAIGALTDALNVDFMNSFKSGIEGLTNMFKDINDAGGLRNYLIFGNKNPEKRPGGALSDFNKDGTLKPVKTAVRERQEFERKARKAIEDSITKAEVDSVLNLPMDPSLYKTEEISPGVFRTPIPTQDKTTALLEEIKGLRSDLNTGKLKLIMDGRAVGETLATNYTAFS